MYMKVIETPVAELVHRTLWTSCSAWMRWFLACPLDFCGVFFRIIVSVFFPNRRIIYGVFPVSNPFHFVSFSYFIFRCFPCLACSILPTPRYPWHYQIWTVPNNLGNQTTQDTTLPIFGSTHFVKQNKIRVDTQKYSSLVM
jgi:hypothetical protein